MLEDHRRALLSAMDEQALWPADSPWVREAMESLPRDLFAPPAVQVWTGERYEAVRRVGTPEAWAAAVHPGPYASTVTQVTDGIPTSSISCAAIVATMLDSLALETGHAVLELGAGSGWNAALMTRRAARVTSVEVDGQLASRARHRIEAAGRRVEVAVGDGDHGWPAGAPFDRVVATYAVESVPWAWVEQTRPGGRIVTPWGHTGCVALTVARDGASAVGWMQAAARFMPARGSVANASFQQVRRDEPGTPAALPRPLVDLARADVLFALRVLVPDVRIDLRTGPGAPRAWLSDGRASWAVLTQDGVSAHGLRGGERDVTEEVARAWRQWEERGAPGMFDFGLHVTADGQHAFTGDDPNGPRWHPLSPGA
ncbi:Protein-L-isoaspartate O-methyltransferase [Streptomyces sp. ADI96-02]|uniref:methyltransferase domain-containing protein n=1 Tax=Streptomyces sp. ADI96-02 TaxID=1522760 RepID=UPI000F553BD9|nr:methyltransferase domain-containing protein [Streptomyces sp. ADI96-02]RPK60603.1 Protein-L-isoaspartate O-methyltransferase [Streptomyces sp. ADI96-02]